MKQNLDELAKQGIHDAHMTHRDTEADVIAAMRAAEQAYQEAE